MTLGRMEIGENSVSNPLYAALLLGSPLETRGNGHLGCAHKRMLCWGKSLLLYKEVFLLCHTVAEVHRTQPSPPARATGRNCRNSRTLFRRAEYDTDLNTLNNLGAHCCFSDSLLQILIVRLEIVTYATTYIGEAFGGQDTYIPFPKALGLLRTESLTEKSFLKIESEMLNSRPGGFLSYVCVYSHFSHYLQNRQEGYLSFDKTKIKSK